MGKVDNPFEFTGRIGLLTFYRRRGSEAVIVRTSKGISGKKIKTEETFARTRENNQEFTARNILAKGIYSNWKPLSPSFNYNIYNALMSRTRAIQVLESVSNRGKRGLPSSQQGQLLEGLSFNNKFSLENIVSVGLDPVIDINEGTARIQVPELRAGMQFHNLPKLPFYQFVAEFQTVPDIHWQEEKFIPDFEVQSVVARSEWHNSIENFPGIELNLQIPALPPKPFSLMLSMAVVFGRGNEEAVTYTGAGKILKVVGVVD